MSLDDIKKKKAQRPELRREPWSSCGGMNSGGHRIRWKPGTGYEGNPCGLGIDVLVMACT